MDAQRSRSIEKRGVHGHKPDFRHFCVTTVLQESSDGTYSFGDNFKPRFSFVFLVRTSRAVHF
jgi:hypothetical protein